MKDLKNKKNLENMSSDIDLSQVLKEKDELKKQVEELTLTIDKVEDDKLNIENQFKRALADYHNLLNNSERRNEIKMFQARKTLCESVIPALDSLSIAITASDNIKIDENGKAWLAGIKAVSDSLKQSFEELGLKQYIPVKGDKFDSNLHEALATVQEGNSGEIYDLVQPGYILDNTVIRPARVVVSK